ncbi:AMP-binding protein, partial [uncultured Mycolicibacterium sp.]|uniref:AMP-binding protein n=1 Tax=uncultured Mycolicibacterium sp. TaxID=2320817 RepID=UPI00263A322D
GEEGDRGVTWLPFFHDMGLIAVMLSPMIGHYVTFMTPAAFVRRPGRWIRELARKEGETGGSYSVAPNFAFDHAAARGVPRDGEPPLDLSNVKAILNGSEPISAATVRRFNEAFGPFGFKPQAIKPSYGLAEATLFVSTTPIDAEPKITYVDRDELNRGRFVPVPEDSPNAVPQAGAGKVGVAEWAVIVDAETASELPDGQVGEIWISGQNMGTGYWNKPEETVATFQNTLKSRTTPSHAEGASDDATWVRTGDLGAYYDGELYITGRVKDLIIIDGRNHYPQDIEATAQEATKALRTGFVAAFSVPANQLPPEVFEDAGSGLKFDPENTSEQLVIVGERAPGAHKLEVEPIINEIRSAVAVRHGVAVRDVLLTPAGAIPRTSSGKIGRRACRAAYLDGSLRAGKVANAFPDETD